MNRLSGKTAVVTGASKGIGAGIAKRLAVEGAATGYSHCMGMPDAPMTVSLMCRYPIEPGS